MKYSISLALTLAWLTVSGVDALAQDHRESDFDALDLEIDGDDSLSLADLLNTKMTTATKVVALSSNDAPSIVTVITRADIQRYGFRHIGEALATVPGLFVIDDYVTHNVGVRGISAGTDSWSRIIKFMIDGHPVQYGISGGALVGPEYIPMSSVEAIEVIRGPASALYGANAFLGVVNVITRTPEEGLHGQVQLSSNRLSADVGRGVEATVGYRAGKEIQVRFLGSGSYQAVDRSGLEAPASSPEYERYSDSRTVNDLSRPASAFAKLELDANKYGTLGLSSSYQYLDAKANFAGVGVFSEDGRFVKTNTGVHADYTLDLFRFGDPLEVDTDLHDWYTGAGEALNRAALHTWAGYGLSHPRKKEVLDANSATTLFQRRRRNSNYYLGAEASYATGLSSLLLGLDHSNSRDAGDPVIDINRANGVASQRNDPEGQHYTNNGYYAQLMLYPVERLGLTTNLRYDSNDLWGDELSYRGALVARIRKGLHFKLLYGVSFVPPAPTQLTAVPLTLNGGVRGNLDDLVSQSSQSYEAEIRYAPLSSVALSLTAFHQSVYDRVEFLTVGQLLEARNLSTSDTIGSEFVAKFLWEEIFAETSVAYQRTEQQEPDFSAFQFDLAYGPNVVGGNRSLNAPEVIWRSGLGVTLAQYHVEGSMRVTVVSDRKSTLANITENGKSYLLAPYATLDAHLASIGLNLANDLPTRLTLHATNITNTSYSHGGALGVDVPGAPRSIYLNLEQEF